MQPTCDISVKIIINYSNNETIIKKSVPGDHEVLGTFPVRRGIVQDF